MTVFNTLPVASDWLKFEEDNYFSRDTVIIAAGSGIIQTGTVLAQVTATGKYVPAAATGSDGSQVASAILFDRHVDATSADVKAVAITRHAIASHAGLIWGATITNASMRAAANGQLATKGIQVREGA